MLFHKTPEKAFPGNRETQINRRLENTHGAHHRESRATSSRSGKIQEARTCKKNRHAIARRLDGKLVTAIRFKLDGQEIPEVGRKISMVYYPDINEYNGIVSIQFRIEDWRYV